MPRHPTVLQNEFPYHIGARCINKEWFNLPMEQVWEIFSRHLFFAHHAHNFKIHLFVLMSNHFHLIGTTPDSNLSQIMCYLMKNVSRDLTQAGNRINETFAGRHWKCIIGDPHYYLHAYKYAYQNPVVAKMSLRAEEYPYSTLNGLLGLRRMYIPLIEDETLFSDVEGTLNWLNNPATEQNWRDVGNALKRAKFRLRKDKVTRASSHLETGRF